MKKPKSQIYLSDEVNVNRRPHGPNESYFPLRIHDYNGDVYSARLSHLQVSDILRSADKEIRIKRMDVLRYALRGFAVWLIIMLALVLFFAPGLVHSDALIPVFQNDLANFVFNKDS